MRLLLSLPLVHLFPGVQGTLATDAAEPTQQQQRRQPNVQSPLSASRKRSTRRVKSTKHSKKSPPHNNGGYNQAKCVDSDNPDNGESNQCLDCVSSCQSVFGPVLNHLGLSEFYIVDNNDPAVSQQTSLHTTTTSSMTSVWCHRLCACSFPATLSESPCPGESSTERDECCRCHAAQAHVLLDVLYDSESFCSGGGCTASCQRFFAADWCASSHVCPCVSDCQQAASTRISRDDDNEDTFATCATQCFCHAAQQAGDADNPGFFAQGLWCEWHDNAETGGATTTSPASTSSTKSGKKSPARK